MRTNAASNRDAAVGPAAPLIDSGSGGESDSSGGVAPDPNAVKEGLITSDDTGELGCAECGRSVGQLDRLVLRDLIAMVSRVPPRTG